MSDLFEVDRKVKEGAAWRSYITVDIDGEEYELCYRQLHDDEFASVVDIIGQETFQQKFEEFGEVADEEVADLSEEDLDRIEELQSKETLSNEERAELNEYAEQVDSMDSMLGMMDPDLVEGMHYAGRCAIVPDDEDVDQVLAMTFDEQEELFGETAKTETQARELAQKRVDAIFADSTGFDAYLIGFEAFLESMSGN